jgi:cytochrome c oxidase subunit 4
MSEHIVAKKTYVFVWMFLLIMLGLTVAVSYIRLGWLNAVAAVGIAVTKAVVIIMFFMHVRYNRHLVWIFVCAGFFWLSILFALSFGDYLTRAYMPPPTIWNP